MQVHDDMIWNTNDMLTLFPSVLYHLEPLGVGTPYVGSLTSFIKRLAQAHHLTVGKLVEFCSTQTQDHLMPSTIHKLLWIDGITPFAEKWAQLVSKLTCQSSVAYLTMANWKKLINGYKLLRYHQAWCPQCYAEWAKDKQPIYEPLLWRLQSVNTCLIHQCQLVNVCPGCGQQFVTITANGAVGFCAKCRTWLGGEAQTTNTVVTVPEVDLLSQTIGSFLTLAPHISQYNACEASQTIEMLHSHRRIPYTQIEVSLQIGLNTLRAIRKDKTLPSLRTLVRLTWLSETNLLEMLNRSTSAESGSSSLMSQDQNVAYLNRLLASKEQLPAFAEMARTCGLTNAVELQEMFPEQYQFLRERMNCEQQQALQNVLVTEPIVSVAELARSRGEHQADLYRNFPELCKQIMQVYQEQNKKRCSKYLQEIIQSGSVVPIRTIAKRLRIEKHYLKQWFPDELQLIKMRIQHHKQQRDQYLQQGIETALTSELIPPISLTQVAIDLSVSEKTLKRRFPAESQKIMNRRREFQKTLVQVTCDRIKQIVIELHRQNIYPSVDRLHSAIGTWMIHGNAYRDAYIEAMAECGYRDIGEQSSLRRYIST